jgi:toxin ParE1/3/4
MRLRVYPAALADADEACDWYNHAQAGLGEEFAQELEQALDVLLRQPGMGSKRYAYLLEGNALRFWALDRFPFLVFYRVQGDALQVLRILHERRDIPTAWMLH